MAPKDERSLLLVGEAPISGRAADLLDELLGGIGVERDAVCVTSVLESAPPDNRDPLPQEVENGRARLLEQVATAAPRVVCALGNFATRVLRGEPTGITRLHGREEVLTLGERTVRLYPLFHPAAALYTPANVEALRVDFRRIPELLALPLPAQPSAAPPHARDDEAAGQLELF